METQLEPFYLGQCVDWTFPFYEPDPDTPPTPLNPRPVRPVDLTLYDRVQVHFGRRLKKGGVVPEHTVVIEDGFVPDAGSPVPNVATHHSDVSLFTTEGVWRAQAWAHRGEHRTPSSQIYQFQVEQGVPPAPVP